MDDKILVTMEGGRQAEDLTAFEPVDLYDTFNIHAEFLEGVIGLVRDAADSNRSQVPYSVSVVLDEAEDRLKMLSALAEEMGRRLGMKL